MPPEGCQLLIYSSVPLAKSLILPCGKLCGLTFPTKNKMRKISTVLSGLNLNFWFSIQEFLVHGSDQQRFRWGITLLTSKSPLLGLNLELPQSSVLVGSSCVLAPMAAEHQDWAEDNPTASVVGPRTVPYLMPHVGPGIGCVPGVDQPQI